MQKTKEAYILVSNDLGVAPENLINNLAEIYKNDPVILQKITKRSKTLYPPTPEQALSKLLSKPFLSDNNGVKTIRDVLSEGSFVDTKEWHEFCYGIFTRARKPHERFSEIFIPFNSEEIAQEFGDMGVDNHIKTLSSHPATEVVMRRIEGNYVRGVSLWV